MSTKKSQSSFETRKQHEYVGKLIEALYRSRSAPSVWRKNVRENLKTLELDACLTMSYYAIILIVMLSLVFTSSTFLYSGETGDLVWNYRRITEWSLDTWVVRLVGQRKSALGTKWSIIRRWLDEWRLERCISLSFVVRDRNIWQEGWDEELHGNSAMMYSRSAEMSYNMAQDRPELSPA